MKKVLPLILLISNLCFGQVNLNLGLRAYYPFSGNANDVSGNNNNPVFNNATLTADRLGNPNSAYHFNGTNTYMQIPNHATLNMGNKLSLSMWVRPTGYYTGQCYNNMMLMKGITDASTTNYSMRFSDVYTGCTAPTTTQERFFDGQSVVAQQPLVQLNQWYHVVVTYDGITSKLYVNCILQASNPAFTGNFTNPHDIYLGHHNSAQFPYWLNGDLDEIRIYDRALTVDEVNVLGGCVTPFSCNNWLRTQAVGQRVTVGDLDVTGNQITIEANFNCSSFPLSRPDKQEDIVSKHSTTTDINYVLRMDLAGITTTNGQFLTPFPCDNLVINKTYHVALVYNGSTLKFYRDGFLMSQIAATGNLITNNWQTTIGDYAVNNPVGTNFLGYINEVRIWNVARTQSELRTYMDASLPNPTTQPGLLAYYTFDNLLNKQGNAIWNGTLNNGATINNTNPNCSFVVDSCALASCDTWLKTTANGDYVTIGDLDITGNQLTVEAAFNRTASLNSGLYYGHLISKHSNASDVNYALLPNGCEITTSNGYKSSFQTCLPDLNKTYHVAMVYDGINLKYYRNGILISQVACTGNLVTNDLQTTIAQVAGAGFPPDNQFKGYINEVRIWNVARTQAEIQTYMNASLPNPTTQTGLKGYYVFNDLLNKQGTPAYNATLNGGATINTTNLNCTFTPEIVMVANAGPDTTFCSNTTVSYTLQGTGNGTYSWTPAIYLNNPNLQNPTATVSSTTTFYLTVSSASACSAIDSVTIYVNPLPIVKTLTDTAICKGSVLVLTTTAGLGTYHWSPGIYVSDSTIASPVFIDNQPRTLYVTGTTAFGCSAKDTINITIKPSPTVKTIEDTLICSINTVTLFTGGAQTYTWTPTIFLSNPNIASPVFSGNSSQTYYVTGTAANGCTAKDTVNVNVNMPMVMQKPPDKSMCVNGSVQLDGYNGNTVAYLWSPATYLSSTTIINPIANPPASTAYTVKISDLACIHDSTFTVQVLVGTGLAITVSKSNDVDCAIRSANLLASGGDTYLWTPSTGLSNPNIANPVATPINTQKYVVRVSNALGCFNTDSVTVYSNLKASLARYMPNAFTPNGDGLNDCYGLKNWMHIKKLEFMIFNRYGEQIFFTADPSRCWDGTYKGKRSDPGTYVFYIKAQTDCGTEEQKGNFLLIR